VSPTPLSVCVYCGARMGARPQYRAAAERTGALLAAKGWRLVYGAGDVGLMGTVAGAAQAVGGATMGVIPRHLLAREAPGQGVGAATGRDRAQVVVTETMHERKKVMFMNAEATIVLPGGAGSLDEFFEVLTWAQLGLHAKPTVLLDTEGYWQPLVALLDHVIAEGFAEPTLRGLFDVAPTPEAALALIEARTAAAPSPAT
jgi:uncharacterized protein (TIGR00730 family)